MPHSEPEEFVTRSLESGIRSHHERRALQGVFATAVAIVVSAHLRNAVSPLFGVAVFGCLVLFALFIGTIICSERFPARFGDDH